MNAAKPASPKLSYIIPAFRVIQDAQGKDWTLAGIFDVLIIPKELEFLIISFQAFGRIEDVAEGESTTEIKIINTKNRKVISSQTLTGSLIRGFVKFRAEFNFIRFDTEGKYHFEVVHNGKDLVKGSKFYFMVAKMQ